jgi:hypothetical protein
MADDQGVFRADDVFGFLHGFCSLTRDISVPCTPCYVSLRCTSVPNVLRWPACAVTDPQYSWQKLVQWSRVPMLGMSG